MTSTPPLRPATLTYCKTPPALPPADRSNKGSLVVTLLSAYDLPSSSSQAQQQQPPPIAVSMSVAGSPTVHTGPPSARHKDRNSYRFVSSQVLRVDAPLSTLYKNNAVFTLEYANPQNNLTASLACKSVHIHETQWLILNLEPTSSSGSTTTTTTTTALTTKTTSNATAAAAAATATGTAVSNDDDSDDSGVVTPTLRLQVRLEGPYRTEIAALVSACNVWFATVDRATDSLSNIVKHLPTPVTGAMSSPKYLLIPGVPLVTAAVVLSPIVIGILIVGFPIMVPLLVAVAGVLVGVSTIIGILLASTKSGRKQIGSTLSPMYHTLLSTPSGQCLVYETGPRPTPVSIARSILPKSDDMVGRLVVSLILDAMGSATYLIPGVGEVADVLWAPFQVICIMAMYDTVAPNLKYVSFVEEILPFTDVVPSATIGWCAQFGPQLLPSIMGGGGSGGTTTSGTTTTTSGRMNGSISSAIARSSTSTTTRTSRLIPPVVPSLRS